MIKQQSASCRSVCVNEDCQAAAVLEEDQKFCGDWGTNQIAWSILAGTSQGTEDGQPRVEESSEHIFTIQLPAHLICQLCSKPYEKPRILPCLHSFCEKCLNIEIQRSETNQTIKCPICQKSIIIPEGGVNAIHQNLHLMHELEVARYMSKISRLGDKSCDACIDGDTGPAVVFCCTCHKLLCSFCHKHHKHSRDLCNHDMVALNKESLNQLPILMKSTDHSCSIHEEEKLKFFCDNCRHLVCRDCIIALHKDHKITEICNFAKVHREGMREALVCAQEVTSKLTSAVDANEKMAEDVRTSTEKATLLMNEAFEQIHQTIEERKKTLLSEIAAISLSKTTALTLEKEQFMYLQDQISRYTEMTSHILQTYTDQEVAAFIDLIPNEMKAIKKKVENMSLTPNQSSDIHVYLDSGPLIKELSIFGAVMDSTSPPLQRTWSSKTAAMVNKVYCIEVETKISGDKMYNHSGQQVKGELRSKSHSGAVVRGETEDHGDGAYTITRTPHWSGPHQPVITVDGEHVARSPFDLDVRPKKTNYLNLRNPQQVINCSGGPSGIAIDDSGDIYVACWKDNSIHVFDQAGHQKMTIGSKGSCDGQFNRPFDIFIKGDVMFVADYGNNCIQKLTTQGKFIHKFGQQGSGQGQFSGPVSVIVDQKDRMIVSDHCNHRVIIMDQANTWLLTINGNVPGNPAFKYPWGLALDPQGNIHVAVHGSNTIKVFTSEGTYVRSYGGVKHPIEIAIDDEGYSLVCGRYDDSLSIFDPRGNMIHTVGNLNVPRGVLLNHKNGILYVANRGANTVLKYSV